ncbi:hypothetical protein Q0590_36065 [Rhodocytophaga aerolata]|uniref:YARHG domain-containing protein n=1 Tax=Rhodocytophaga aerolata TaxID=455078 RepID=A0ABT8RI15_9BACT|nr:hypothetical protein [Rhodocytophaga aerolata]MDO1451746.1 hypothetical protein [Rhodocytophaga aerolata]
MRHWIMILFSLLLFQASQTHGQHDSLLQSPNRASEDTLQFKLPAKKKQISPFPDIRDHQQKLSDWNKLMTDTTSAEQQNLESIVHLALLAMVNNNPDKTHQMEGFYRMVSTENEKYTKLIEAAVTIQDTDYKKEFTCDNLKVQVNHLRQSNELGKVDSAIIKGARVYVRNAPKVLNGNYLYRLNQVNLLRGAYREGHIFNQEGWLARDHIFKLTSVEVEGNDTIYTIAFRAKGNHRYSMGYLKINSSDYAIIEYEHANYVFDSFTGRVQVICQKQEGKYYPQMIRYEFPRLINGDIGEHQLDIHTLWIDRVLISGFKAIKSKDQIHCDQEIHTFRHSYDPSFWTTYKMLQRHPLAQEIQESLETGSRLDKQFKENAATN